MTDLYYDKKKHLFIPDNWDELSPAQYLRLAKLLHGTSVANMHVAADKALHILSNKRLLPFLLIDPLSRLRMHPHVEWVFKQERIAKQLIPRYRHGILGKTLYGPESEFDNLQMAEFHHTELAYFDITQGRNEEDAVNELVAILYREPKPKPYDRRRNPAGDLRIAFSYPEVAWNKKTVARWPHHIKAAIVLWYDGCRQLMRKLYPEAFSKIGGTTRNYSEGMFDIMRNISGSKYGDFEKVETLNVHTAFRELVALLREDAAMEAKMKATP